MEAKSLSSFSPNLVLHCLPVSSLYWIKAHECSGVKTCLMWDLLSIRTTIDAYTVKPV